MSGPIFRQRCFNHLAREAAARCPGCQRFFCRECITEHEDRVLCANCVRDLAGEISGHRHQFTFGVRLAQIAGATLLAWVFFYWAGQTLLSIDPSFHEGTVWKDRWWPGY
jgi:hypothetical protein